MTPPDASEQRARALAAGIGALTGVAVLAAVTATVRLGWSWADAFDAFVVTNAVMALAFGGCGALLAWHRPGNAVGWLFAAGGLLQALSAAMPPMAELAAQNGAGTGLRRLLVTAFVYGWPWAIGLCVPLALLLFPDGRPASPRWWPVVAAVAVTGPLFVLDMASAPEPPQPGDPVAYLNLPFYDALAPLWTVAELGTSAAYLLALAALVVRFRRGDETVRRQLLWLLLALVVAIAAMVVWGLVSDAPEAVLLCIPLVPVAVTVAIVRHGLLDIRLVVSRALTWLLLSLAVLVAYAAVVAALDQVVSSQVGRSAAATVLLVLVAAPALPRLQRLVDQALYGDRADPARLVSRLGAQLATPDAGLTGVVTSMRRALRLPYVALERNGLVLAADGPVPNRTATEPLTYGGEVVGRLQVGLRDGERRLADADRRVLRLLAAPLAVAVHATAMSVELQGWRERLVGAREEERRRLRRELHDGLGPALTGIAFTADAAANLVQEDAPATVLLARLRHDSRAALADVRRVVEELRPPALDELGLVGALQRRAEQLSRRADGGRVLVQLDVPQDVPVLPAAVEVAAYRIATEALTNVARHSHASTAVVALRCSDGLEVSVSDDGPASGAWAPGVGLQAMRERAAELGGALTAGSSPTGGRVLAWLPLAAP